MGNQGIRCDCGDLEGFNKLAKVYDNLMKSSKFTAAQNKSESGEFVDSVGELIYHYEEKNGFVPEFHLDEPKDIVDITLKDFQDYTYRLVTEERGLGDMIEKSLQQMIELQKEEEGELDSEDEFISLDEMDVLGDLGETPSMFEFDEEEEEEIDGFNEVVELQEESSDELDNLLSNVKKEESKEEKDGATRATDYDF